MNSYYHPTLSLPCLLDGIQSSPLFLKVEFGCDLTTTTILSSMFIVVALWSIICTSYANIYLWIHSTICGRVFHFMTCPLCKGVALYNKGPYPTSKYTRILYFTGCKALTYTNVRALPYPVKHFGNFGSIVGGHLLKWNRTSKSTLVPYGIF